MVSLLLLGALTGTARADSPGICREENFAVCLGLLLQQRCAAYSGYSLFSSRAWECRRAVTKMVEIFSPFQPVGETNVVAFPHRIGPLIENPSAFAFLADLPSEVSRKISLAEPFRLWDYAVLKAGGREDVALEWIGVFLQDTNPEVAIVFDFARVNTGEKSERKLTTAERATWKRAIEAIAYARLADRSGDSDAAFIRAYPRIDTEFLSEGIYHFYFAAHVARMLRPPTKSATSAGRDMSGFAPFLLNALYEMHVDIDENLPPWADAAPFPEASKKHSVRDVYTSYLGALFGLGGVELVAKAEPFPSFSKRFAADPRGTLASLYARFRPR